MGHTVVRQRDPCLISGQRHAVELRSDDTTAHAAWVLESYVVAGRVVSKYYSEARPCPRYAWIQVQRPALQTEPEDPFEARPVHPSGRPGVPGPSATSDMGGRGIEVGAGDIGLDFVALNCIGRGCSVDGAQCREQLTGLVAVAEHSECNQRPDGGM